MTLEDADGSRLHHRRPPNRRENPHKPRLLPLSAPDGQHAACRRTWHLQHGWRPLETIPTARTAGLPSYPGRTDAGEARAACRGPDGADPGRRLDDGQSAAALLSPDAGYRNGLLIRGTCALLDTLLRARGRVGSVRKVDGEVRAVSKITIIHER